MGQAFLMGQSGGKVDFSKLKPEQIFTSNIRRNSGGGTTLDRLKVFPQSCVGRVFIDHTATGSTYSNVTFTYNGNNSFYEDGPSDGDYSGYRILNQKAVGVNLTYEDGLPTIEFDDGTILNKISRIWCTTNSNTTDVFATTHIVEV